MKKCLWLINFPFIIWLVLIGTLLSRFGTSMVFPYITTILVQQKHLAVYWPGLALAASYFMQSFSASMGLRFFHNKLPIYIIQNFSYLYALAFSLLGCASLFIGSKLILGISILGCFMLIGLCRSFIESTGQALISEVVPYENKAFTFSLLYVLINVGTVLGPIAGLAMGILNTNWVFLVTSIAVLSYGLLFYLQHKTIHVAWSNEAKLNLSLTAIIKTLSHNRKLTYFILASIFIYMGFSQMETLFALISYVYTHQHRVFVYMYAINGAGIVFLQMLLVQWSKRFNMYTVLISGTILLSFGLLIIAGATLQQLGWPYYLGAFVFTLGEIFTLSYFEIYLDAIAQPENRYLYFSIGNFALLGRILGPVISSVLCYFIGLRLGLISIAIITLFSIVFIYIACTQKV